METKELVIIVRDDLSSSIAYSLSPPNDCFPTKTPVPEIDTSYRRSYDMLGKTKREPTFHSQGNHGFGRVGGI